MTKTAKTLFIIISAITVIMVLSMSVKAYANDKKSREYKEAVAKQENCYVREIRNSLDEFGFKNAGINLTKEYDENRNVTYNLSINHYSFEYASEDKLNEMEDIIYINADKYLNGNVEANFTF